MSVNLAYIKAYIAEYNSVLKLRLISVGRLGHQLWRGSGSV